jgi:hypothetical protein
MKESGSKNMRRLIAQHAARLMAEEGMTDYSRAKRKAAKQLGNDDDHCLPSNAEVEQELRLHHEIFHGSAQPQLLHQLRSEALEVMRMLERFNPHLSGAVLDGTAGRYADIEIHLFVDSAKDIELFLLNKGIPYQVEEKPYHFAGDKHRLPVFVLDGMQGAIRLIIFATDDLRTLPKSTSHGNAAIRAGTASVAALLQHN